MFFQLSPRERAGYIALAVILLAIAGVIGYRSGTKKSQIGSERIFDSRSAGSRSFAHSNPKKTIEPVQAPSPEETVVHVVGAVRSPGVYKLKSNSRVQDAVHAAGGPTSQADLAGIDLAAKLVDGEQVRVPAESQGGAPASSGGIEEAGTDAGGQALPQARGQKKGKIKGGTVSINSGAIEDLESLPGVGPATARRILDWRSANGPFSSVDQLREVGGIGPKKFAQLAPYVRL